MYTENKPLGRHCKICNPFFYEFRVILSAIVSSFSATLFTTEAVDQMVDPNRPLFHLMNV
jgi:hypothetical protein